MAKPAGDLLRINRFRVNLWVSYFLTISQQFLGHENLSLGDIWIRNDANNRQFKAERQGTRSVVLN